MQRGRENEQDGLGERNNGDKLSKSEDDRETWVDEYYDEEEEDTKEGGTWRNNIEERAGGGRHGGKEYGGGKTQRRKMNTEDCKSELGIYLSFS